MSDEFGCHNILQIILNLFGKFLITFLTLKLYVLNKITIYFIAL